MSSITDFISYIKTANIVRSNRFSVNFILPSALLSLLSNANSSVGNTGVSAVSTSIGSGGIAKAMSMTCLNADLPGFNVETTDTRYGNLVRHIANGRTFESFTTTFLLTGAMVEKKIFDAWYATIFNDTNNSINYYDSYTSTVTMSQLDVNDNVLYSTQLLEAYPIHVGTIKEDRTATNTISTVDITWAFYRIKPVPLTTNISVPASNSVLPNTSFNSAPNPISSVPLSNASTGSNMLAVSALSGAMNNINTVIASVQNGSISNLDGVKIINSIYADFSQNYPIPSQDNATLLASVNQVKAQMQNLAADPSTITNVGN